MRRRRRRMKEGRERDEKSVRVKTSGGEEATTEPILVSHLAFLLPSIFVKSGS